jgi:hypothetical protein
LWSPVRQASPLPRHDQGHPPATYLAIQQDILETFVDRGQLRQLATATVTAAGKRIPRFQLDHLPQLALRRKRWGVRPTSRG